MAFPMMPMAQWDVVRKMTPDELNRAAMGEYQEQGVSPVFALARIKEETALTAAFQAQAQKQQQEEEAKMKGVPVEELPETIAAGVLRERGITGVDSSAGRDIPPDKITALQNGIAGGLPVGVEGLPVGVEEPPSMMAYGGGLIPRMAYGGLIPGYHEGHLVGEPDHGVGPGQHLAEFSPYVGDDAPVEVAPEPQGVEYQDLGPLPQYQRVPHPRDWEGTGEEWMAARDAAIAREEDRSTRVGRGYENYVESLPLGERPMSRSNWEGMEGREILAESSRGFRERFGSGRYGSPGQERLREIDSPEEYEHFRSLGPGAFPRMEPSWAENPANRSVSSDSVTGPDEQADSQDAQVSEADTQAIMEVAGAGWASPEQSRVEAMLDQVDELAQSAGTYSPAEQNIHVEELRIKRQVIADLDRLDEMRQAGIQDDIGYLDAKDEIRKRVENTTNLRFDEIEEEQRAVRGLGAAQISDIGITQAARRGMSDVQIARLNSDQAARLGISDAYIAQVRKDLADRREASTAQQGILGDIFDRRTILSKEQLEGHKALAADQEKAIRKQAGFAADSTLFTGVGDVLRGDPRNQMFSDVTSAVSEIRGGELEDLMGVQTNLLEKTTEIQDELIAEERSVFEEIYNVGEVTQTAQEAATAAEGISREGVQRGRERVTAGVGVIEEGVQGALERGQTEKHNIQNRVLDSQLTSNQEIYTMSQLLLNSKFLALEERRVLQAAINTGDIEAQREILAAHADFAEHENTIRAEVESMHEDAERERLAVGLPATLELARMESQERSSRESTAAQERTTRENILADPKSWQALEQGQQHRIQDIEGQDYTKNAEGETVRGAAEAAEMKRNAIAGLEQQYSRLLERQWGFLRRQGEALASQRDPTVVQTVMTRLVSSGMPENYTREQASEWISEQEVGLKGQMQRRSVENAAGLAEVLRRGRGGPPSWATGGSNANAILYQMMLENDPDFTGDPSSVLYGESQPMTGIRSIPKGSAGEGYGDTPLVERPRRDRPLGLQPDTLESLQRRLRNRQSPTSPLGG